MVRRRTNILRGFLDSPLQGFDLFFELFDLLT